MQVAREWAKLAGAANLEAGKLATVANLEEALGSAGASLAGLGDVK
jgi:hypothetical protein